MAGRITIPNISRKSSRSRKHLTRASQIPPPSRDLIKRPISNYDIKEILSKTPTRESPTPYSSYMGKQEINSLTPSASPLSQQAFYFPRSRRSVFRKEQKLTIGLMPKRPKENLRYNTQALEECESYKNLNGVSTPPEEEEEERLGHRTLSPFSEIIDEQLKRFIDNPSGRLAKLDLGKYSGLIEDSGGYSTNDSRKRCSKKRNGKNEKVKSPKSFSIMTKLNTGKLAKLRGKKSK